MHFPKIIIFFLSIIITVSSTIAKGHLVIIGGGKRPDYIMDKVVQLAGGTKVKIVIIPVASSVPEETGEFVKAQFERVGAKSVEILIFSRETADEDSNLRKLKGAKGIFFSGGDQVKLTQSLSGTKLLDSIRKIYAKGGVVSGTSAGASAMSKVMVIGNELGNEEPETVYSAIKEGTAKTGEGFGFIDWAIVDQHFVVRKRENRLLSLVLENPNLVGVGIDEATAIIVKPDNSLEVLGESSVMIIDARRVKEIKADRKGNLGGKGIEINILLEGDRWDVKQQLN
jgi:cyanophycinase